MWESKETKGERREYMAGIGVNKGSSIALMAFCLPLGLH